MRDNFAAFRDYCVYYVVHTGTGVYSDFSPVGTENSTTEYTTIATWGSPPFNLPPRLTMRGVTPPLSKILVFQCGEELRQS